MKSQHWIAACLLLLATAGLPAAAATHAVPVIDPVTTATLPDRSVEIDVPAGWTALTKSEIGVAALELSPPQGRGFLLQISAFTVPPEAASMLGPDALRQRVEAMAAPVRTQSVETELKVEQLSSGSVRGWWFSATDRTPVTDYRYLTSGLFVVDGHLVNVTLLLNEDVDGGVAALREQALAAIATFRLGG